MCCSVLQCVAVRCSVLQCIRRVVSGYNKAAEYPEYTSIYSCVLQCVAVCCSVMQCVAVYVAVSYVIHMHPLVHVAVSWCSVLLVCVAVSRWSVLQSATLCDISQRTAPHCNRVHKSSSALLRRYPRCPTKWPQTNTTTRTLHHTAIKCKRVRT